MEDGLIATWREAARDLGLRVEVPFALVLPSGATVVARLLLRDFGATNGMLIVTDYSAVQPYAQAVIAAGFGYSTLPDPRPGEKYERQSFVEMLLDWGWSGAEHDRPHWCPEAKGECNE